MNTGRRSRGCRFSGVRGEQEASSGGLRDTPGPWGRARHSGCGARDQWNAHGRTVVFPPKKRHGEGRGAGMPLANAPPAAASRRRRLCRSSARGSPRPSSRLWRLQTAVRRVAGCVQTCHSGRRRNHRSTGDNDGLNLQCLARTHISATVRFTVNRRGGGSDNVAQSRSSRLRSR